jgi:hypothetical protein
LEHFYKAQENLSSLHKGWRSAEKNLPVFFNMRVLYLHRFLCAQQVLADLSASANLDFDNLNKLGFAKASVA